MEIIVGSLLSYLISLAAGMRLDAMAKKRKKKLNNALNENKEQLQRIQDVRSFKEQLKLVTPDIKQIKKEFEITENEKPLLSLFTREDFQDGLARWLSAYKPDEKKEIQKSITEKMVKALRDGGASEEKVKEFSAKYFKLVERQVFNIPALSEWRLTIMFNAVLEEMVELKSVVRDDGDKTREDIKEKINETQDILVKIVHKRAERFTDEERQKALERYRELALESLNIIDLANLPESDRHVATNKLEIRHLYVPLRLTLEFDPQADPSEEEMEKVEKRREADRLRLAGWTTSDLDREKEKERRKRVSVGERLQISKKLVILGDPGAGKTTLIRWMATAYLLQLKQDVSFRELPDVATLPRGDFLPIVIRCRDLPRSGEFDTLDDVLRETFRKNMLPDDVAAALLAATKDLLAEGKGLLLVDGLDEIGDPSVRARFCEQLERIHIAFPQAFIVVTSRIVGYREMCYRIGRGFEHLIVSDFLKEEKDEFADKWCKAVEPPERREKATEELKTAIHSSDRIERLTGNPMLLTTLALVKRKVGKLPNRRIKLYEEAVEVLLHWRSEVDEPIDSDEAIPQLEYLAYEMCSRGVQQIRKDEVIELFEKMREEFPNLRAAKNHDPEEFLQLLERRTAILFGAGETTHGGRSLPVYEFRHLTFQEYLSALALVDGRYPNRDRDKSLAEQIAPLAGQIRESEGRLREEHEVTENWREVLRLCIACCNDDDVDNALLAILNPMENEDNKITARPRAVLSALCLADEPNVSDVVANKILKKFANQVGSGDGSGGVLTTVDTAAMELAGTLWEERLIKSLLEGFLRRKSKRRGYPGGLCGMVRTESAPEDSALFSAWLHNQVEKLNSGSKIYKIDAAIAISLLAYRRKVKLVPGMIAGLLSMLKESNAIKHAGAWAIAWLVLNDIWKPKEKESKLILAIINDPKIEPPTLDWLIEAIGKSGLSGIVEALVEKLEDKDSYIRKAAAKGLGKISDTRSVEPLVGRLEDEDSDVRDAAAKALGKIGDPCVVEPLVDMLKDKVSYVSATAAKALGKIGDKRSVDPLVEMLEDKESYIRSTAAQALGKIGSPRAIEPLVERLEDNDTYVRKTAVEALGEIGDKRAIEPLIERLDDKNYFIRRVAVVALGKIGDKRVIEPLVERLEDKEEYVRQEALGALVSIMGDETDTALISRDIDGNWPWLDPADPIGEERVAKVTEKLEIPEAEVRSRYEALADRFGLKLTWRKDK